MPSHPVQIGPLHYPSKNSAKRVIQLLRDRYKDNDNGQAVCVSDESDHGFLTDLLALHHEAEIKKGEGIDHFFVAPAPPYGTFCFHIRRTDGSTTDFSFDTCISGPNLRGDRLCAMREAVADQTRAHKQKAFAGTAVVECALSGAKLAFADAHVDHVPLTTFQALVESWLTLNGLVIHDVVITAPADNQYVSEMADSTQRASWVTFHAEKAQLRILSANENLSGSRMW